MNPTIQEQIYSKYPFTTGDDHTSKNFNERATIARNAAAFAATLYDKQLAESLALYNNQTQTIIKRDGEIENIKAAAQECVSAFVKLHPLIDAGNESQLKVYHAIHKLTLLIK